MSATASLDRGRLLVNGAQPRLVQAGPVDAAEAVVFVHGNPGSADDWAELVAALGGAGRRALAIDLPDFGETTAPPGLAAARAICASSGRPGWSG
jgi:pimeloyl-ACP methyl ester carboxylesterase